MARNAGLDSFATWFLLLATVAVLRIAVYIPGNQSVFLVTAMRSGFTSDPNLLRGFSFNTGEPENSENRGTSDSDESMEAMYQQPAFGWQQAFKQGKTRGNRWKQYEKKTGDRRNEVTSSNNEPRATRLHNT